MRATSNSVGTEPREMLLASTILANEVHLDASFEGPQIIGGREHRLGDRSTGKLYGK